MSKLHPRFAQMTCPAGTVRRITVLGVSRTNSMEADKRLFRQIYQLRICTEIEDVVTLIHTRVRRVAIEITNKGTGQKMWGGLATTINPGGEPGFNTPGTYQTEDY
jgi:hypothetical protein